MIKLIGTMEEIDIFLNKLKCPLLSIEGFSSLRCPALEISINCINCCTKEYELEINHIE